MTSYTYILAIFLGTVLLVNSKPLDLAEDQPVEAHDLVKREVDIWPPLFRWDAPHGQKKTSANSGPPTEPVKNGHLGFADIQDALLLTSEDVDSAFVAPKPLANRGKGNNRNKLNGAAGFRGGEDNFRPSSPVGFADVRPPPQTFAAPIKFSEVSYPNYDYDATSLLDDDYYYYYYDDPPLPEGPTRRPGQPTRATSATTTTTRRPAKRKSSSSSGRFSSFLFQQTGNDPRQRQ